MITAYHSGDRGDLFAAMASFEAWLQGDTVDLVLPRSEKLVRESWYPEKVQALAPLLEQQKYIGRVRYSDEVEGINLDLWRKGRWGRSTLADMFARFLNVPLPSREKAWLRVDRVNPVAPVVMARSPRYRERSRFQWRRIFEHFKPEGVVFVGSSEEYDSLNHDVGGGLHWHQTKDMLELARVLAGSQIVVCNQSAPFWVATALQVKTVWLEQHKGRDGNCTWKRPGAVFDRQRDFPTLTPWSSAPCEAKPPAGFEVKCEGGRVANLDRLVVADPLTITFASA